MPKASTEVHEPRSRHVSVIGPDIMIDGSVTGRENLMVEGELHGSVKLESDLRIGSHARMEATIHARNVAVEGTVIGDVSADQKIELVSTARVDGNMKAPKIVIAEGAKFRGSVDMGSEPPKSTSTK
ncbi:MAG: polymer-forming cytoskeletal protein [Acidobacteriota bacterium]